MKVVLTEAQPNSNIAYWVENKLAESRSLRSYFKGWFNCIELNSTHSLNIRKKQGQKYLVTISIYQIHLFCSNWLFGWLGRIYGQDDPTAEAVITQVGLGSGGALWVWHPRWNLWPDGTRHFGRDGEGSLCILAWGARDWCCVTMRWWLMVW